MNNERSLAKEITEGFEALKSMRNNEPVAWMAVNELNGSYSTFTNDQKQRLLPHVSQCYGKWIPLYTHPVKEQDESFDRTASHMAGEYVSYKPELTDEEIIAIGNAVVNLIDSNEGWLEFAKAILRKAQE